MYYIVFFSVLMVGFAYQQTPKQVTRPPAPTDKGIYVSDSLIQHLLANPLGTLRPPLAAQLTQFTGNYELDYQIYYVNLDDTPEKEVVFDAFYTNLDTLNDGFYPDNLLFIWGKRGEKWREIGSEAFSYMAYIENEDTNFAHEIDTVNQLLILKETARGSGYNGLFHKVCKIQKDTLVEVLAYPCYEYSTSMSFQFDEVIQEEDFIVVCSLKSGLQAINSTFIQIEYNYMAWIETERQDTMQQLPLLTTQLKVLYQWDSLQYKFVPKPQKIGTYELKDDIDVMVDNFPDLFADTLKVLAQKGNKEQRYYLKHFEFDKYKK